MALTVAEVVGQFKADVGHALSAHFIERACRTAGHTFRRRLLDPVTLIHAFLLQIPHGNIACTALPRPARASRRRPTPRLWPACPWPSSWTYSSVNAPCCYGPSFLMAGR